MANAPTATSGSSNNNSKSPPTLSQVVALFYTYQRIVLVWGACPAVTVLLPFLTSSSLTILNCLTAGYGITSLLLSPLCLWTGYALIHSLARTRQSLEKALQTNQVRLPVGAFLLSVTVTRWVAGPLLAWWRLDAHRLSAISTSSSSSSTTTSSSSSYGSVPLVTALWCAWGMACAGLAVVARYIGPASVMRCSAVPLRSNPLETSVQHLLQHPWSVFEPSDTPGERLAQNRNKNKGGRYQHLQLRATCAQTLLAIVTGVVLSSTTVFHCFDLPHGHVFARSAILATSVLTLFSPILMIGWSGHELDPTADTWSKACLVRCAKKAGTVTVLVPITAVVAALVVTSEEPVGIWSLYAQLVMYSLLMSVYLQGMDQAVQSALFYPPPDLKRFVNSLQDDSTPVTRLAVILHSLLRDAVLVEQVSKPTLKPGVVDLDRQEQQRTAALILQMGAFNLSRNAALDYSEAPLEEDVLRLVILESLGGPAEVQEQSQSTALVPKGTTGSATRHPVVERHALAIKEWVEWKFAKGGDRTEPLVVPLVRAFCVFAGGLGESLLTCSSRATLPLRPNRMDAMVETWALPPGAVVSAKYAVTAVTRCIIQSLRSSGRPLSDWKSTHLSTMVPSALAAFFHLRCGVLAFSKYHAANRSTNTMTTDIASHIGAHSPELLALLRVCDDSAHTILTSLKAPKSLGRGELPLDKECLAWTKQLLA